MLLDLRRRLAHIGGSGILIWLCVAIPGYAQASRAGSGNACKSVTRRVLADWDKSGLRELRLRLVTDRAVKRILDIEPAPGPEWKEGNPFWEQAYGILQEDVYNFIKNEEAKRTARSKTLMPGRLQPALCERYEAIVGTDAGSVAYRILEAIRAKYILAQLEKKQAIPTRLRPWVEAVKSYIHNGLRILSDPEIAKDQASYRQTGLELAEIDREFARELDRVESDYNKKESAAAAAQWAKLLERHKARLTAIASAFSAPAPLPGAGPDSTAAAEVPPTPCRTDAPDRAARGTSVSPAQLEKRAEAGDEQALSQLRSAAEAGEAASQYHLARAYMIGSSTLAPDDDIYITWLKMAAKQGYAPAEFDLGEDYARGILLFRDPAEAMRWWTRAAEGGDAGAQARLGRAYAEGVLTPKDDRKAFVWMRSAARCGNAEAMTFVARMYAFGIGVHRNPREALRWLDNPLLKRSTRALAIRAQLCRETPGICQ